MSHDRYEQAICVKIILNGSLIYEGLESRIVYTRKNGTRFIRVKNKRIEVISQFRNDYRRYNVATIHYKGELV